MTKRMAKPRLHSICGRYLDGITLCEVIPARYYNFSSKTYSEGEMPETQPELTTELRCAHCNYRLTGQDLEYVMKRMKEDGEGQVP